MGIGLGHKNRSHYSFWLAVPPLPRTLSWLLCLCMLYTNLHFSKNCLALNKTNYPTMLDEDIEIAIILFLKARERRWVAPTSCRVPSRNVLTFIKYEIIHKIISFNDISKADKACYYIVQKPHLSSGRGVYHHCCPSGSKLGTTHPHIHYLRVGKCCPCYSVLSVKARQGDKMYSTLRDENKY